MKQHCYVLLFALTACAPEPEAEPTPTPVSVAAYPELAGTLYPETYAVVAIRGHAPDPFIKGNSREGLAGAASQGVSNVEVDFQLTRDGVLVSAHSPRAGGTCGNVTKKDAAQLADCTRHDGLHLATLEEVLAHDFENVYVDLKPSARGDDRLLDRLADAIVSASSSESRKTKHIVAMTYRTAESMARKLAEADISGGMKGYPKAEDEVMELVQRADEAGFEMVCVKHQHITPEILRRSAELGIWHLPWALRDAKTEELEALAKNGSGGLITARFDDATEQILPQAIRFPTSP